jgi:hypothetical protein
MRPLLTATLWVVGAAILLAAVIWYMAQLPSPVAAKRDAIHAAAARHDYEALAKLIDPHLFTTSIADPAKGRDRAAYWKSLEANGTDIGKVIAGLLEMPYAVDVFDDSGKTYIWPAFTGWNFEPMTDADKQAITTLYNGKPGAALKGYCPIYKDQYCYAGWTVLISRDGRWVGLLWGIVL